MPGTSWTSSDWIWILFTINCVSPLVCLKSDIRSLCRLCIYSLFFKLTIRSPRSTPRRFLFFEFLSLNIWLKCLLRFLPSPVTRKMSLWIFGLKSWSLSNPKCSTFASPFVLLLTLYFETLLPSIVWYAWGTWFLLIKIWSRTYNANQLCWVASRCLLKTWRWVKFVDHIYIKSLRSTRNCRQLFLLHSCLWLELLHFHSF